jgi:hypothetical protein
MSPKIPQGRILDKDLAPRDHKGWIIPCGCNS